MTKKSKPQPSTPKKIAKIVLLLLVVVIIGTVGRFVATQYVYSQRADKKCTALEEETLKDVASLGGYTVASHKKECGADSAYISGDSMSHWQTIRAKVTIDNPEDEANFKAKFANLKDKLPAKDYHLNVQNIRAANGNPPALCLMAFRFLDKTAQNNLMNNLPPQRYSQYIEPGVDYSDWRCADL